MLRGIRTPQSTFKGYSQSRLHSVENNDGLVAHQDASSKYSAVCGFNVTFDIFIPTDPEKVVYVSSGF